MGRQKTTVMPGGTCTTRGAAALACAAAAFLVVLVPAAAASEATPAPAGPGAHVTVEAIPGGSTKRITLSARAEERLGIRFGTVSEGSIPLRQLVGGVVVTPVDAAVKAGGGGAFSGFSPPPAQKGTARAPDPAPAGAAAAGKPAKAAARPANGEAWIRVSLSPAELERAAPDKPARITALAGREPLASDLMARPSGLSPVEDARRSMLWVYYVVPAGNHGLALDARVRVELEYAATGKTERIVPYAAVYYDGRGDAWVYRSPKPLTYERQRVTVERIVGDQAMLSEGPPAGTSVVVVGAALLYGAEVLGK
jgi:hypothetical protein